MFRREDEPLEAMLSGKVLRSLEEWRRIEILSLRGTRSFPSTTHDEQNVSLRRIPQGGTSRVHADDDILKYHGPPSAVAPEALPYPNLGCGKGDRLGCFCGTKGS